MIALSLKKIHKTFGPTIALDGVDLDLRQGEVHALIGENGAGKSTLMNVIAGSLRPDQGTMEIQGEPYSPSNPLDARTHGIALIHQELSLCPHLSVAENVLMGIESSRLGWLDRDKLISRTNEVLKTFHHADIRPERRVGDLSVAARQIVEISRAIAAQARIILMDEPTSSLQREDVDHLFTLIRKLSSEGISVIYISHFLEEVRQISDRFTVLRDGRSVATGDIATTTDEELISKMVGRAHQNLFPVRTPSPRRHDSQRSQPCNSTAVKERQLRASPRRDTRHRRSDGIRAHSIVAHNLRSRARGKWSHRGEQEKPAKWTHYTRDAFDRRSRISQ